MKKRKGRIVINQDIHELPTNQGDSAYWNYALNSRERESTEDGEIKENIHANPDSLEDADENKLWGDGVPPELASRIIEEFTDEHGNFPILSKQENIVLRIYVTTGDIKEVQRLSKLSRSSINTYMARIRSKMLRLLKSRDF